MKMNVLHKEFWGKLATMSIPKMDRDKVKKALYQELCKRYNIDPSNWVNGCFACLDVYTRNLSYKYTDKNMCDYCSLTWIQDWRGNDYYKYPCMEGAYRDYMNASPEDAQKLAILIRDMSWKVKLRQGDYVMNKIIVVTRHLSLLHYLEELGFLPNDQKIPVVSHATRETIEGKNVIGVLPNNLACYAESITEVGLNLPPELRGKELTLQEIKKYSTGITTYKVTKL